MAEMVEMDLMQLQRVLILELAAEVVRVVAELVEAAVLLEFRRIAEANPEQLADSVIELYRSLDEIVSGVENFAANLGVELPGPEEEMLDANLGGEGDEGLHGEMPEGGPELPEGLAENPLEAEGERLESPAEQEREEAEGTEGTER